mmetsp:Transcript_15928/g.39974  ORF Transcript_15928/g.39974 Transcript_15928/m.39974 type:complete len:166 (-) Transcript_15928:1003-1500(-)
MGNVYAGGCSNLELTGFLQEYFSYSRISSQTQLIEVYPSKATGWPLHFVIRRLATWNKTSRISVPFFARTDDFFLYYQHLPSPNQSTKFSDVMAQNPNSLSVLQRHSFYRSIMLPRRYCCRATQLSHDEKAFLFKFQNHGVGPIAQFLVVVIIDLSPPPSENVNS